MLEIKDELRETLTEDGFKICEGYDRPINKAIWFEQGECVFNIRLLQTLINNYNLKMQTQSVCATNTPTEKAVCSKKETTELKPKLALDIAKDLIYSERQSQYGSFKDNMSKLSILFNAMTGINLTEEQCTQFLIALKFARESTKHKRDNLVDVIGYIALLDDLYDKE